MSLTDSVVTHLLDRQESRPVSSSSAAHPFNVCDIHQLFLRSLNSRYQLLIAEEGRKAIFTKNSGLRPASQHVELQLIIKVLYIDSPELRILLRDWTAVKAQPLYSPRALTMVNPRAGGSHDDTHKLVFYPYTYKEFFSLSAYKVFTIGPSLFASKDTKPPYLRLIAG